ncbi:MAG: AMP-binding protein [Alphaproteobacteria bacterium]|nr:AMP-binding protein [Alphaproteobacteria bacterium SS10]
MTDAHYDALETRSHDEREARLMAALTDQVAHAKANSAAYADMLADVDPASVTDRAALAKLPVTRKSDLTERQSSAPPLGGFNGQPLEQIRRVFSSPGPIYEPQGDQPDFWRFARALYAAGFRAGDIVHNCFAYHFTPAGFLFDDAAKALGCPVFPAGTGNTEGQAQAMAHLKCSGYAGTPDYLKVILEKGDELGLDTSSLVKASVGGGPLMPDVKAWYETRGVAVYQNYGTADLGLIAYETPAREGLVCDEGALVEIVRPGTGDPVAEGEVGEVVVTLFNPAYPLIRFATGDLSAVMAGDSPCGRTNMRLKGWMGRADQATKVKGMFVRPEQIAEVLKRHDGIGKARLVVDRGDGTDVMTLKVEAADAGIASAVTDNLAAIVKLKGNVEIVEPGSLPNDGKVIDDVRSYD